MEPAYVVALASVIGSVLVAVVSVFGNIRLRKRARLADSLQQYEDELRSAYFDLGESFVDELVDLIELHKGPVPRRKRMRRVLLAQLRLAYLGAPMDIVSKLVDEKNDATAAVSDAVATDDSPTDDEIDAILSNVLSSLFKLYAMAGQHTRMTDPETATRLVRWYRLKRVWRRITRQEDEIA